MEAKLRQEPRLSLRFPATSRVCRDLPTAENHIAKPELVSPSNMAGGSRLLQMSSTMAPRTHQRRVMEHGTCNSVTKKKVVSATTGDKASGSESLSTCRCLPRLQIRPLPVVTFKLKGNKTVRASQGWTHAKLWRQLSAPAPRSPARTPCAALLAEGLPLLLRIWRCHGPRPRRPMPRVARRSQSLEPGTGKTSPQKVQCDGLDTEAHEASQKNVR